MRRRRPLATAVRVAVLLFALVLPGVEGPLADTEPARTDPAKAEPEKAEPQKAQPDKPEPEKSPRKGGLSLDELMKQGHRAPATAPPAIPPAQPASSPPAAARQALDDLLAPAVPPADPSRGQLSLDGIEAGREGVKVADARERIRVLGDRLEASCACVAGSACFQFPRLDHDEMNAALDQQAGDYEQQARELCAQWSSGAIAALPDRRQALVEVEQHLQQLLDTKDRMHAALDTRADAFLAEQRRIERAIAEAEAAAAAEAQALAQQGKKRSGLLAGVLTLGAGALVADSLGMEIDPDKLARTSLGVSRAVANGEGVAGALGAGVQGFSEMARTAVPKIDVPAPPEGGAVFADAMAHVKRFPEPGAGVAPGAALPGSATQVNGAPNSMTSGARDYADLLGSVGSPAPAGLQASQASQQALQGVPSLPDGISPDAMAEGNAALQRGADMLASGVTPGGPGTDAFGVGQPTTEKFTFGCMERSNFPLSDGAGGTTYYYERKISAVIRYWTPACGPALKAYYIAYACNQFDDYPQVEAGCVAACGSRDCRDAIYEKRVLGGGS